MDMVIVIPTFYHFITKVTSLKCVISEDSYLHASVMSGTNFNSVISGDIYTQNHKINIF